MVFPDRYRDGAGMDSSWLRAQHGIDSGTVDLPGNFVQMPGIRDDQDERASVRLSLHPQGMQVAGAASWTYL